MKHKSSASAGKCWDAASNMVKDKATQNRKRAEEGGRRHHRLRLLGQRDQQHGQPVANPRRRGMKDC